MSYEKTDVNLKPIAGAIVVFVVATAVICAGVWGLFNYFRNERLRRDVRRSLVETSSPIPPEPRLQVNPAEEWREYYESQQRVLDSYEWVSQQEGTVRIPVRRAMELLVEREKSR